MNNLVKTTMYVLMVVPISIFAMTTEDYDEKTYEKYTETLIEYSESSKANAIVAETLLKAHESGEVTELFNCCYCEFKPKRAKEWQSSYSDKIFNQMIISLNGHFFKMHSDKQDEYNSSSLMNLELDKSVTLEEYRKNLLKSSVKTRIIDILLKRKKDNPEIELMSCIVKDCDYKLISSKGFFTKMVSFYIHLKKKHEEFLMELKKEFKELKKRSSSFSEDTTKRKKIVSMHRVEESTVKKDTTEIEDIESELRDKKLL